MKSIVVTGQVNERHELSALVPGSIPPGLVTIVVVPTHSMDDTTPVWMNAVAQEWDEELSDPAQDIYTLSDGEPVNET